MTTVRTRSMTAAVLTAAALLGARPATAADDFVVHEWGTFSTFSGSNGKGLKFLPNDTDLPDFVHNNRREVKGGRVESLVSLETPVVYFYTDRDRSVSVHVDFPKGAMTDWYPEASRPPSHQIRWDDVKVYSHERPMLPGEGAVGRYFAAREVDAKTVRVSVPDSTRVQYEQFLFYRGVGDFEMPVTVLALGKERFTVVNAGTQPVAAHFLVSVKGSEITFKTLGELKAKAEVTTGLSAAASTAEKLGEAVAAALVRQGLYEKEARAMVKTWKADWFGEDGTRVLYLLGDAVTDELLPMTITPKPDKRIRVLVGRHDVLTPEREAEVDALVRRTRGESNPDARAADSELNKLGRYRPGAQAASEARLKREAASRGR